MLDLILEVERRFFGEWKAVELVLLIKEVDKPLGYASSYKSLCFLGTLSK